MLFKVERSKISGKIMIPPSKSHSLRAILFSSLGSKQSTIFNVLSSADISAMIHACRLLGAKITEAAAILKIEGISGKIAVPDDVIYAGNSGQVLRFITAIAALQSSYVILTGDWSIRHSRPMQPLIDGLKGLGAFCISTKNDGYAPIVVKGSIKAGKTYLDGKDSQPVSALLIAAAFLNGETEIIVNNPGEKPWIDLTLHWLDRIKVKYINDNYERYIVYGHANYLGFDYIVPGDFSSLLFPVAAALITQSEITLQNVGMDDVQGDKKVLTILESMGAKFRYDRTTHELAVLKTKSLKGIEIDVNNFIDSIPILSVMGAFAQGETIIRNGIIARQKECDRISAMATELKKMGADIQELPDGLIVKQSRLIGSTVESYEDHRIAMALAVAGLASQGVTQINKVDCAAKSYPSFYEDMRAIGALITREKE